MASGPGREQRHRVGGAEVGDLVAEDDAGLGRAVGPGGGLEACDSHRPDRMAWGHRHAAFKLARLGTVVTA